MTKQLRMLAIMNTGLKKQGSFEDYIVSFARKARENGWALGLVFPSVGAVDVLSRIDREQARTLLATAPWSSREGIFELVRIVREFKPDIVNFHFCDTLYFLPVFLYCRALGISIVYHYHGEIRPLHTLRWRNIHLSELRLLSVFWNRVIAVSQANKLFLQALHISTPIDVVYNGIDIDFFLQRSVEMDWVESAKKDSATVDCLYIGSISDRKRVDILLRAFAIARDAFPSARLVVVGGGELESPMKELAAELQLDDVVHFAGLVVQYPFELLKRSDILVSASESESFGLVFAEAMLFGLPIVACKVGGIPEVVADGETGLLVEANDPKAFATALLTLLRDGDLRNQMGHAGLERSKRKFQLQETIDATFQCFARVS